MAFCKNCGNELSPNTVFCSKCGEKISEETNILPEKVTTEKKEAINI